jgi:hypothetical protein
MLVTRVSVLLALSSLLFSLRHHLVTGPVWGYSRSRTSEKKAKIGPNTKIFEEKANVNSLAAGEPVGPTGADSDSYHVEGLSVGPTVCSRRGSAH